MPANKVYASLFGTQREVANLTLGRSRDLRRACFFRRGEVISIKDCILQLGSCAIRACVSMDDGLLRDAEQTGFVTVLGEAGGRPPQLYPKMVRPTMQSITT